MENTTIINNLVKLRNISNIRVINYIKENQISVNQMDIETYKIWFKYMYDRLTIREINNKKKIIFR